MDSQILEYFGLDSGDPELKLAESQVNHDLAMLNQLIAERESIFPSLDDFATESGIDKDTLDDFEHDPLDFTLEFIRLYALSVGAEVHHHVSTADDRKSHEGWKEYWLLMKSRGNVTSFSAANRHSVTSVEDWKNSKFPIKVPKSGRAVV